MITLTCPACEKKWSIAADSLEPTIVCPACARVVAVGESTLNFGSEEPTLAVRGTPRVRPPSDPTMDPPEENDAVNVTRILAPPMGDDELGRLGSYRVLSILGQGGMGVVFKAEDIHLKRTVALKAMLPTMGGGAGAAKRFLREAQLMAAVEHDHVVRVYQVSEDRGVPFLALEFLRGESLHQRLRKGAALTIREAIHYGRQIATGLAAAHATGLVHRDIKPANIWLQRKQDSDRPKDEDDEHSPFASVKILDFGLARAVSQDSRLTQRGAIVGTPAYMAPEQARGEAIDHRSDLFSLGVVLYTMVTGRQPFVGNDPVSTLLAVASHIPSPPAEFDSRIPVELSALIVQLLEKDPEKRPASAQETATILRRLEKALPPASKAEITLMHAEGIRGPAPLTAIAPPPRNFKRLAAVAAGLLILGGIALYFLLPRTTATTPEPKKEVTPGTGVVVKDPKSTPKIGKKSELAELLTSPDYKWSAPENLGSGVNTNGRDLSPTLTDDERTIVFSRDRKLWISQRSNRNQPFPAATPLSDAINAGVGEVASLSGDGLTLVFSSDRAGPLKDDIWMSTRPSLNEPFGDPVRLPEPVNSAVPDRGPILSSDGLTLLITTMRYTGAHGKIAMFTRADRNKAFGNETMLPESVNAVTWNVASWIARDGLTMAAVRASKQPFDVKIFTRPSKDAIFGPGLSFGPPFDTIALGMPWIAPDGMSMYFHSREIPGGVGDLDLWMVRRVKK